MFCQSSNEGVEVGMKERKTDRRKEGKMMKNCEHKVVKEAVYIFVVHTHNEALLQNAVLIFQKHLNEGESNFTATTN